MTTRTRTETWLSVGLTDGGRATVRYTTQGGPESPVIRPVLLACTDAGARVSLVPEGALLLAGDRVEISVEVGAGASLTLVEPAGTVAYDMRGGSASWEVGIRLAAGARLVWHGEPFIVSAGSDVTRTVRAVVGDESVLALRETLVLGRHGEWPGRLSQELYVERTDGTPVLAEGLDVPAGPPGLALGGRRVLATVLLAGATLPPVPGTRLDLEAGGTLVRHLDDETHLATPEAAWRAAIAAAEHHPRVAPPESG